MFYYVSCIFQLKDLLLYVDNGDTNGIELYKDIILDIVSENSDNDIVLPGYLNARCGLLQDIFEEDNVDLIFKVQDILYDEDSFNINRNSKDNTLNNFGHSLIELCKSFGIYILNGIICNDQEGNFTCTSNNGCSLVDYVIVSSNLFTNITSFDIGLRSESDHFPLLFKLSCIDDNALNHKETYLNDDVNNHFRRFKWNENKKTEFLETLKGSMTRMKSTILNTITTDINLAANMIVNKYKDAAKPMKLKTNKIHNTHSQPNWWDKNCEKLNKRAKMALDRSPED